jgi:hypothetical protein
MGEVPVEVSDGYEHDEEVARCTEALRALSDAQLAAVARAVWGDILEVFGVD